MSEDPASGGAPQGVPSPVVDGPSPEDLARLFLTSGLGGSPPPPPPSRWSSKLVGALLVAGIGLGASVMSCVGQSFSLRQARALEGIEQQLRQIRSSCAVAPSTREGGP